MKEIILKVKNLNKVFGGLSALYQVNFGVDKGQIKAIIGPNGAGKTTIFNLVSGIYSPTNGEIYFHEKLINGLHPYKIAHMGIGRTFQNVQLFGNMSVVENVMVGRHSRTKKGVVSAAFRLPGVFREEEEIYSRSLDELKFVGLDKKANELSANLPFGEQRLLEIARALAIDPEILLLDEPAAGLNPVEAERLAGLIMQIRARGITVLIVEHHMGLIMKISDDIIVLNYGEVIAEGSPGVIQNDESVISAFLGEGGYGF